MKTLNPPRLIGLAVLAMLVPVSAVGQLNSGTFLGLPESQVTSLGVENLNLIRILGYGGPNINWWTDPNTPLHSFSFETNSTTGFFTSHFYTNSSVWSWSSANTTTPLAMRLTESGKLTLGATNPVFDGPIVLEPNAPGGPTINVAGGIAAQTLQVSGPVNFSGTVDLGGGTLTSFGISLLSQADAASARAALGAAAPSDIPAFTPFGVSFVGQADAAAARSTLGAATLSDIPTFTSFGTLLVNQVDAAAARNILGAAALSDFPLFTPFGSSLVGQTDAASARNILGAAAQIDIPIFTSFGTSWVSHADAAAARSALGAATLSDIPTFTSFGTSLVSQADATAARIVLGAAAQSDVPTFSGFGTSLVGQADAAAARAALGAAAQSDIPSFSTFGSSLWSQVDAASTRTLLGAAAQSDVPPFTSFGGLLVGQADAASARATLGALAPSDLPTLTSFGISLVGQADAAGARSALGAAAESDIPMFSLFGSSLVGELDAASARAKLGAAALSDIPSFTTFGSSLLSQPDADSARAVLGMTTQSDMLPFWKYIIESQSLSYGAISSPASTGSGVTYWPSRNTFLLLDNTSGAGRVLEFSRGGVLQRTISLVGFGIEDIHWISGNTFFISQERNSGSVDEIDVIDLPPTGNTVNITTAVRRLRINVNTFTSNSNAGLEGATLVGNTFYFATEKGPSKPSSSDWYVWKCPNTGTGIITVTPTKAFRLTGLLYGRATDVSGMATDGTYLWMISHEGPVSNGLGRLIKTTVDGRLIEENMLPSFSDGTAWLQAEGIELFTDNTDGKVKIALCGEIGSSPGVDFMVQPAGPANTEE